jgi:hypothetical protein
MFVFHSHNKSVVSLYNNVANSVRRFVYRTVVLDKQKTLFVKAPVAGIFRNSKLKRLWNAKTTRNFRPFPDIK